MPQFARPDADITDGTWLNEAASNVNLFASIDEVTVSDADFVESALAPATAAMAVGTSNVEDPVSSTGHIIRANVWKNAAGGAQIDIVIQLRQGYASEGVQGTLIATLTAANVTGTSAAVSYTLSGAEADAITNYNDLQFRITANQV